MDRTLIIIKPDAIQRGLMGQIISRFEAVGMAIVRIRLTTASPQFMQRFYAEHRQMPHFDRLIDYMTSGPLCFIEMEGADALKRARVLAGATDPIEAAPGTIRGDLGLYLPRNALHTSDSPEAARSEIALVFDDGKA